MAYLFDVADVYLQSREERRVDRLSEILNSSGVTLFSEGDWRFLNECSGRTFFSGMALFCDLIPLLQLDHRIMMRLVETLVRRGGADLAAKQPNVAFRDWCARNPGKAQAVLNDARAGEPLAIDHLCFVIEALGSVDDALHFLTEGQEPKMMMGAATALGRIALDGKDAFTAVHTLAEVSHKVGDEVLRLNCLLAIYSILAKHTTLSRSEAQAVLDEALDDPSAETLNGLAHLIWINGAGLTNDEVIKVCVALQDVNTTHSGTLQKIDHACSTLLRKGHFDSFSRLVEELVRKSEGNVGFADFPSYRDELFTKDPRRLGKAVISCFLEGNTHICASLSAQFDVLGMESIKLEIADDDLPERPVDQIFLCRKAIGFFFLRPVTAASVLVAVLRNGNSQVVDEVLELLYDPLLLSYRGDLLDYIEGVVEDSSEPNVSRLKEVVVRIRKHTKDLEGIGNLVELQPSESRQQIERVRHAQKMSEAMEEAEQRSVFHGLMPTQHLIYGTTASFFVQDPEGSSRFVSARMGSHAVSTEYLQLAIFDPEGLEMVLFYFRHEQRRSE